MGINKYQIARVDDLHMLYRYGFTGTSGYCPKYSAITGKSWYKVTFNTESEYKSINFNICPAYYNWYSTGYGRGQADMFCKILSGTNTSTYDETNIPVPYYYGTNTMYLFNKNTTYNQGETIKLHGAYLLNLSSPDPDMIKWGCLARASLSLTAGYNVSGSLSINCNPIYTTSLSGYSDGLGADHTSTASHIYGTPSVIDTVAWWLVIISPGGFVYATSTSASNGSISYNFNVDTTGTHYLCLIPSIIEWQTQYNSNISGSHYNGVYLYVSSNPYVSLPNRSYSSNMLVRYMDISIVSSRTLTVKVYNNKGTAAKLDNIYAYYDTSTTETTAGTQCGHLSIGNVSKNSTASFTLTLSFPTTVMASTAKYYVHIHCGSTNSKQTWSYKLGPSGSYSSTSNGYSRVTQGIQLFRTSSTDTSATIMPNIFCTSTMSEMTFQIK